MEEVLRRLGVDEKEVEDYILRLMEISEIVAPERIEETPLRDRDDIKIPECAVLGSSNNIVTRDQLLSIEFLDEDKLNRHQNIYRTDLKRLRRPLKG